jgi:hypothetical protein
MLIIAAQGSSTQQTQENTRVFSPLQQELLRNLILQLKHYKTN